MGSTGARDLFLLFFDNLSFLSRLGLLLQVFYGLGIAALLVQLGGDANKAEGLKLMTEVPELRQRIADKSMPLEKLAKHGSARPREGDFYFLPWSSCTSFTQSRAIPEDAFARRGRSCRVQAI